MSNPYKPTDIRQFGNQTRFRLVIWFIVILYIVGLGLVALFYGIRAALFGFFCLTGAFIPIALIALIFKGMDTLIKKE